MLRKTSPDDRSGSRKEDDWQHISTFDTAGNLARRQGLSMNIQCAPEQPSTDVANHVSPAMDDPAGGPKSEDIATDAADVDYSSIISFEAPFSIGRLTIANPDVPGSGDTTPAPRQIPLPPDKSHAAVNRACASSPSSRIIPPELEEPVVQENRSQQPPLLPIKGNEADVSTDGPATVSRHSGSERPKLSPEKTVTTSSARPVSIVSKNLGAQPSSVHDDNQSPYMRSPTSARNYPENRMSHSSQKRHVPHLPEKVRPMSMAPSIPFPASDSTDTPSTRTPVPIPRPQSSIFTSSPFSAASMLANPPTPYSADSTPAPLPKQPQSYDYSPLSASSVLANPPTPYASNHSPNKLQSLRTSHGNLPPNEPPNGQSSRQTETFKLVRSPSGHVYSTSETIVAGGQQWELVETSESKSRSKTSIKSKDRESKERLSRDRYSSERWERRQEGRSQAEPDVDPDHHPHSRSHRNEKVRSGERRSTPITSQPSLRDGADVSPTRTRRESRKGTRGADVERDRRSDRKVVENSSSLDINKPQPPPPPTKDFVPPERRPSLSVRPTSQLPSAAEMTALRAKEAWDMERLWKARSMNGDEPNGYATFPSLSSSSKTGGNDDPDSRRAIHGSSHTAFVVQSPFQTQHSIYHSMPVAPPPIIYSSPSSLPQPTTTTPDQPKRKPYSTPIAFNAKSPASSIPSPTNNPLPQPPQESSYEPAPLPLPGSTGRSSDYWARLAGVTTSH